MVTWTATVSDILQGPRQRHTADSSGQTKQIAPHDIGHCEQPLAPADQRHALEGVTGKGGESPAEPDHYQQPPSRVGQHALGGPDHEETDYHAAADVDDQGSVWKCGAPFI